MFSSIRVTKKTKKNKGLYVKLLIKDRKGKSIFDVLTIK